MKLPPILTSLFLLFLLTAQGQQPILFAPDLSWRDATGVSWYDGSRGGLGVTSASWNGTVYIFNFVDGGAGKRFPYVYTFRPDHDTLLMVPYNMGPDKKNYLLFGYYNETYVYADKIDLWRVCTFKFNGRLWYYQQIKNYNGTYDKYTDCFAQMPVDQSSDPFTYCVESTTDPRLMRRGAFQVGDSLYFIYEDIKEGSPSEYNWVLEEYRYDSLSGHFAATGWIKDTGLPGSARPMGIIKQLDADGNEYVLVNGTGDGYTDIYKFTPYINDGGRRDFAIYNNCVDVNFSSSLEIGAAMIFEGSVKGQQITDPEEAYPDRMTRIGMQYDKNSSDYHTIYYIEYRNDNGYYRMVNQGQVGLPTVISGPGDMSKGLQSCGAAELIPADWTSALPGIDGYRQVIWFFYPDDHKRFNGMGFISDNWMLDPDSIVKSYDLTDTVSYEGIKDLWTLVGITDGAPPVSIDWETWDEKHNNWITPASSLKFSVEDMTKVRITTSSEDQWSVGESVDLDLAFKLLSVSYGEEFNYSWTYKNQFGTTRDTTMEYELEFSLRPESQEYGYFIWKIPKIKRFRYSVYPWWDTESLQYPIPRTTQYLFRTTGYNILPESIPIEEFPFGIEHPNNPDMSEWMFDARTELYSDIVKYNVPSVALGWNTGSGGITVTLAKNTDSTSNYSMTNTYETKVEAGLSYKVPKVFRISAGISASYEVSYTNTGMVSTEFGESVEASLKPLLNQSTGVNVPSLKTNMYLLGPNGSKNHDYYYYEGLNGARPWYIAYIVNSISEPYGPRAFGDGIDPGSPGIALQWPENRQAGHDTRPLKVFIYPNPSHSDEMQLVVENATGMPVDIRLLDITGTLLAQTERVNTGTVSFKSMFPGLNLSPGIYMLGVRSGNDQVVKKVVVNLR